MSKVVSCRIDDSDYEILSAYAKEFDATISWAARRALKDFTTKLAKESEQREEVGDNLLFESDDKIGGEGLYPGINIPESQGPEV